MKTTFLKLIIVALCVMPTGAHGMWEDTGAKNRAGRVLEGLATGVTQSVLAPRKVGATNAVMEEDAARMSSSSMDKALDQAVKEFESACDVGREVDEGVLQVIEKSIQARYGLKKIKDAIARYWDLRRKNYLGIFNELLALNDRSFEIALLEDMLKKPYIYKNSSLKELMLKKIRSNPTEYMDSFVIKEAAIGLANDEKLAYEIIRQFIREKRNVKEIIDVFLISGRTDPAILKEFLNDREFEIKVILQILQSPLSFEKGDAIIAKQMLQRVTLKPGTYTHIEPIRERALRNLEDERFSALDPLSLEIVRQLIDEKRDLDVIKKRILSSPIYYNYPPYLAMLSSLLKLNDIDFENDLIVRLSGVYGYGAHGEDIKEMLPVQLLIQKAISDPAKYVIGLHHIFSSLTPEQREEVLSRIPYPKLNTAGLIDYLVEGGKALAPIIQEGLTEEGIEPPTKRHLQTNLERVHKGTFSGKEILKDANVAVFLKRIYAKEKEEFKKGNYTFYHGRSKTYRFAGEVYKKLWEIVHHKHVGDDFVFLRFGWEDKAVLDKRTDYLFMNHALFGNASSAGANTVGSYWLYASNIHKRPFEMLIKEVFDSFGLDTYYQKYKDKLGLLGREHRELSNHGEILLISITPDKIDSVKPNGPGGRDVKVTIDGKPETNSRVILDMLQYSPKKVLVDGMPSDRLEWALPITNEYALNPVSGPKFYSFYAMDADKEKTYIQHRDALFEEIRKDIEEGKKKPMARL